jgi:HK97 family phage major capsid protein
MASEVAKRLRDRRLNVWNECKGLAEGAANENRSFTDEEQGRFDAMQEEMTKLDVRIKAVLDTEKRAKEADDAFDALSGRKPEQGQAQRTAGGGQMLEEVRKWARGEEGAPKYLEIRHAQPGPINYRVLTYAQGGSPAGASSIIPTDFYDMLIAHLIEVSGIMQCGPTVLNTGGGETLQIPKTTAHSFSTPSSDPASATQAGSLPTGDPAFSMVTLSAYKFGIMLQVARELIDDTAVDLLGYLAMQAGRAIGNDFGYQLVNGAGTNAPTGLMTGTVTSSPGVTGATTGVSGAPSYANLVDLEYSVIAPYRQSRSCYWLAADKTIGGFRKITDTVGRPIWEPSAVLGSPDLLLGKPLVADPFMPALGVGNYPICFGDFSQFFVRLVGGVRFERSDDFAFGSDLVTFRAILRGDGTLVDQTGAVKSYKAPSS